jgi:hypothetical protein
VSGTLLTKRFAFCQHALDSLGGFVGPDLEWEVRAYQAERQFQLAGGGIVEFNSEQEMLEYVFDQHG